MRRISLYGCRLAATSSPQALHQLQKLQEIFNATVGAPPTDGHEGLRLGLVRPLGWHGEESPFVIAAVEPVRAPTPTGID